MLYAVQLKNGAAQSDSTEPDVNPRGSHPHAPDPRTTIGDVDRRDAELRVAGAGLLVIVVEEGVICTGERGKRWRPVCADEVALWSVDVTAGSEAGVVDEGWPRQREATVAGETSVLRLKLVDR